MEGWVKYVLAVSVAVSICSFTNKNAETRWDDSKSKIGRRKITTKCVYEFTFSKNKHYIHNIMWVHDLSGKTDFAEATELTGQFWHTHI